MLAIEWYLTVIVFVLIIKTGSGKNCSSITQCRCHKLERKLFADCSDLNLETAPYFPDDVVGINFAKNKFSNVPQSLPKNLLFWTCLTISLFCWTMVHFPDTKCFKISRSLETRLEKFQLELLHGIHT